MIITVVGNDHRQKELAKLLNRQHDTFYLGGSEDWEKAKSILKISDIVIFPLPFSRDNKMINNTHFEIDKTIKALQKDTLIFAGGYNIDDKNRKIIDYNVDEEFVLKNAFYTAESAMALSIINTSFSLCDAKILILGNGRIGKALQGMLTLFCENLTVSARKQKDFDYLKKHNSNSVHTEKIQDLSEFDVIFNTIPASVLSKDTIKSIKRDALIIDLASKNSLLNIANANYIDAKALPAKYCMKSSAKALLKVLDKHIKIFLRGK
ncbi:MAG: hypothetical protein IJD90_03000 [Clostridia bacterium]|nr:hypothetical protein [Clostridia bacterium]